MKKSVFVFSLLTCFGFVLGCHQKPYAKFSVDTRRITIETEPAGASVTQINLEGTTNLGTTPLINTPVMIITSVGKMRNMPYSKTEDLLRRVGNVIVRIEKQGYQTYTATLNTEPGHTVSYKINLLPN